MGLEPRMLSFSLSFSTLSRSPMSTQEQIDILLGWCRDQGIVIDSHLKLLSDSNDGIGVFTGDMEHDIPANETGKGVKRYTAVPHQTRTNPSIQSPRYPVRQCYPLDHVLSRNS
jgi:hypothetical protein